MIDIHAHVLPGVDDGSRNLDETKRMLDEAQRVGVSCIVATPHLYSATESRTAVLEAYEKTLAPARERDIELLLGAEINVRAAEKLKDVRPYAFQIAGIATKYALLELNNNGSAQNVPFLITEWLSQGVTPIIVHPERYRFVQESPRKLSEFRAYGCLVQVDAQAFMGFRLGPERKTAEQVHRLGLMDFIASDAHRPGHYDRLASAMEKIGTNSVLIRTQPHGAR